MHLSIHKFRGYFQTYILQKLYYLKIVYKNTKRKDESWALLLHSLVDTPPADPQSLTCGLHLSSYKWTDNNCNNRNYFICQLKPRGMQHDKYIYVPFIFCNIICHTTLAGIYFIICLHQRCLYDMMGHLISLLYSLPNLQH